MELVFYRALNIRRSFSEILVKPPVWRLLCRSISDDMSYLIGHEELQITWIPFPFLTCLSDRQA